MQTAVDKDADVRKLVLAAERAAGANRPDEFQRLYSQAQALAPEHPLVLNLAGVQELQRGNPAGARRLFERALEGETANPALWINLATSLRRLSLPEEEMRALERALAIDPRHVLALLQKGSLLEVQGKRRAAARVYQNVLQAMPRGVQLAPQVAAAVQRARAAVKENDAALAEFLTSRLERGGEGSVAPRSGDRMQIALDTFLGRAPVHTQRPTFFYFPRLPAPEFFPRADFPWLTALEAATADIRNEFQRVVAEDSSRLEPYIAYPEGVPLDQWRELNHSRRWSACYLWRDGVPVTANLARCPRTAQALAQLPMMEITGYAPTAFFSILDARTKIPPHTGVTNTRVICHLPLVVPPGCGFRVGWETREWRAGEAWVFDDTYEHAAWNDSEVPRGILIFDVWNPYLSPTEREQVASAVTAIREYYRGEAVVGKE
jgi:aspartyl/asparaginyl beta-hydroxylase (cupin superfamily)/Tfp pilus assembly protein PilF